MAVRTSRLDQMEEYIRKHDFVPLDDLCVAFQRSKITIRRDLSMLEEKGVIEKVYGGARPRHRDIGRPVASFTERNIRSNISVNWPHSMSTTGIRFTSILVLPH